MGCQININLTSIAFWTNFPFGFHCEIVQHNMVFYRWTYNLNEILNSRSSDGLSIMRIFCRNLPVLCRNRTAFKGTACFACPIQWCVACFDVYLIMKIAGNGQLLTHCEQVTQTCRGHGSGDTKPLTTLIVSHLHFMHFLLTWNVHIGKK